MDSTPSISLVDLKASGEREPGEIAGVAPTQTLKKVRILLVDDQPEIRRGLRMRLGIEPGLEVVGEAGDGREVLEAVRSLYPDVVLMDVSMPGVGGIEATAALAASSTAAVVMLSLHDDTRTRESALAAGAAGFVAKHEPQEALVEAIRRAARNAANETGGGEM